MLDMNAGEFTTVFGVRRGEQGLCLHGHPVHDDPAAAAQRVEASLDNPWTQLAPPPTKIASGVANSLRASGADAQTTWERGHTQRPCITPDSFSTNGVSFYRNGPAQGVSAHPLDAHRTRAGADVPQQLTRHRQQPGQSGGAQIPLGELAVMFEGFIGQAGRPPGDQRSVQLQRDNIQSRRCSRESTGRGVFDRLAVAADAAQHHEAARPVSARDEQISKGRRRFLVGRQHQDSSPGGQFTQRRVHIAAHDAETAVDSADQPIRARASVTEDR